jgi:hypothetical protein
MPSNTCQFVKQNNEGCKRPVAAGQNFCWQHARGLSAKWHSLTRKQTVGFYIGLASLAATVWFGIHSVPPVNNIQVQSSGDQSPNVVDNEGKVEIHNQQSGGTQKPKSGKSAVESKQ